MLLGQGHDAGAGGWIGWCAGGRAGRRHELLKAAIVGRAHIDGYAAVGVGGLQARCAVVRGFGAQLATDVAFADRVQQRVRRGPSPSA